MPCYSYARARRPGRPQRLAPSAYQLCAAAQHTLGLAAIGSQIDSAYMTVRVRVGDGPLLAFVGEAALWWIANSPPPALHASFNHLLGEIREWSVAP
jgi:DNA-binding transcriptional LysR family regulator